MATKIVLLDKQGVGAEILKSAKPQASKNFKADRFDVKIFGPDDKRVEQACKDDKSLANDLKGACLKAYQTFVADIGKFLSDQAVAREKLKGAERKKFDDKFSSPLYAAGQAAFKKFEAAVESETKKRWQATVADDPKVLSGVRWEPVLIEFLASFDPIADAAAAEQEVEPDVSEAKWGEELILTQQAMNRATRSLKGPIDNTAKIPELIQLIRQTVARVKDAYEKAPRESQKDNPETEGEEEMDEGALNKTIFNRYSKEIQAAENAAVSVLVTLTGEKEGVEKECGGAAKDLNEAIKRLAAMAQKRKNEREAAAELQKSLDNMTDAVKKLLAIQSDAKVGARSMQNSWNVLRTVREKKGSALDLIDEALVDLKSPNAALVSAAQLIEKSRVFSGLGT